jgi:putative membrane protein
MMMGMMGLGLLAPLLVIGAVAYVLGWRPQSNVMGPILTSQSPVEILKARYARGEITREEYDQIYRDLEG